MTPIPDQQTLNKLLTAGRIAAQVRQEGAAKLIPGVSALEVMDFCEQRIQELGGQIAWAQMAINDTAAHFCPEEDDQTLLIKGDLVKIDIGVHLDGWIADNAMTVDVGNSGKHTKLILAAQNALTEAVKNVRAGTEISLLGRAQITEAEKLGYTTIRNLSGHTIKQYKVHGGISIPSFDSKNKTILEEGWQIAIEPFVTNGDGLIKEKGKASIFMVEHEKGVRSPPARAILEFVRPLQGLPFTTRWLTRKFGKGTTALGLRELIQNGIVKEYPPLVEISRGLVAQFEHSMIVTKDSCLVYTRHEQDTW